jgi:hypothetical protein
MQIRPGDRLFVQREQEMVRRTGPAYLGANFRNHPWCFITDPHGAKFAHWAGKGGPILRAFNVGQHRSVKDDQRRVARSLCREPDQIGAKVATDYTRRVPTGDCQGCAKVRQAVRLSWPYQGFEPGYLVIIVDIDRIRSQPRSPVDLDSTDRKRRARARSAS